MSTVALRQRDLLGDSIEPYALGFCESRLVREGREASVGRTNMLCAMVDGIILPDLGTIGQQAKQSRERLRQRLPD
jgi:hypothetical protein